jgi:nucleotidyltransferase/DNA polymerase involved in DNA repair
MADLMRVSGVGRQFGELLKAAGVDTIKELRTRNADNLAAKLAEVNAEKKLAKKVPTAAQVQDWIEQAKTMEPMITH